MAYDGDVELLLYTPLFGNIRPEMNCLRDIRVATLGPGGTSSEHAAKALLRHFGAPDNNVLLHKSFEDAFDAAALQENIIFLFANAYAGADRFYMSSRIDFFGCFLSDTPNYGVAAKCDGMFPDDGEITIASHHAPISLIPWFLAESRLKHRVADFDSTAAAAEAVRDGLYDYCVTNELSVDRCGLKFLTRTRPIRMLWSFFGAPALLQLISSNC